MKKRYVDCRLSPTSSMNFSTVPLPSHIIICFPESSVSFCVAVAQLPYVGSDVWADLFFHLYISLYL